MFSTTKTNKGVRQQLDKGSMKTCAKFQGLSLQKTAYCINLDFCVVNEPQIRRCLVNT